MDPAWARAIHSVHLSPRLWIGHMKWRPRGPPPTETHLPSELCTLRLEGRGQQWTFREHLLCVCTCLSFSGSPDLHRAHYMSPCMRLAHSCHSLEG